MPARRSRSRSDSRTRHRYSRRSPGRSWSRSPSRRRQSSRAKEQKTLHVSQAIVGRLIGKGGETVKALERETGARIDVSKDNGEPERTVNVSGSLEAVEKALASVEEIIKNAEGQINGHGRSRSRSRGDGRAPVERKVLQVPGEYVGMIIGKGGETVKAMQKDTGAKIEVSRYDADDERTVTLSGSAEAIEKAVRMIMDIINRQKMFETVSSDEETVHFPQPPPGFEDSEQQGWLRHPGLNIFFEKITGRLCWFDATSNMYRNLHQGETFPLTFNGFASTRLSCASKGGAKSSSSSSSAAPSAAKQPAAKHVVIPDLHRVGQVLKLSLDHLDRPSAMLGVFGPPVSGSGVPVEIAARGLHEKLIHRLAANRSEWPDDAFFGALTGAFVDIAAGYGGAQPVAAVAMTTGRRVIAVATPGARLCIFTGAAASSAVPSPSFNAGGATTCFEEISEEMSTQMVSVALTVGESCLDDDSLVAAAAPQLYKGRLRAASLALIRAAAKKGATGPIAAAVARLRPAAAQSVEQISTQGAAGVQATSTSAGSAGAAVARKVRVHQILVRYWSGKGAKPSDPVKRRPISRSVEEAEMLILDALEKLTADGGASFSSICKKISECQSALKGGDLSGDLGWLDQAKEAALKQAKGAPGGVKSAVKSDVPTSVLKAAFELEVGEVSDIVSSEIGLHLIMRTA